MSLISTGAKDALAGDGVSALIRKQSAIADRC
jgi:hypothetical protein